MEILVGKTCSENIAGFVSVLTWKYFMAGFVSVITQKYLKRLVAINIHFNRWRKTWWSQSKKVNVKYNKEIFNKSTIAIYLGANNILIPLDQPQHEE